MFNIYAEQLEFICSSAVHSGAIIGPVFLCHMFFTCYVSAMLRHFYINFNIRKYYPNALKCKMQNAEQKYDDSWVIILFVCLKQTADGYSILKISAKVFHISIFFCISFYWQDLRRLLATWSLTWTTPVWCWSGRRPATPGAAVISPTTSCASVVARSPTTASSVKRTSAFCQDL